MSNGYTNCKKLNTLGKNEIYNELSILERCGTLVSLRGIPNGEFAKRMRMPLISRLIFSIAGSKIDKLAAIKQQKYYLFL